MPELPEVETIIRRLRRGMHAPALIGLTILDVTTDWPRHFIDPDYQTARTRLRGQTIRMLSRHGKYLLFHLEKWTMLLHLRMSGDLAMVPSGQPPERFDHTRFHLSNKHDLVFQDARKFGTVELLSDPTSRLKKLGPDALDPDLDDLAFRERIGRHKRMIKPLLMDQSFLAGLGNIYTDESLFLTGIHPRTRSDFLGEEQSGNLLRAIKSTLEEGIKRNGASIDWVYRGGDFQNHFHVYQRTGEPCTSCGTPIERIVVGQRGTHYCPSCQPEVTA